MSYECELCGAELDAEEEEVHENLGASDDEALCFDCAEQFH